MLIILSPAKMMDMSPTPAGLPVTDPEFRNDAELLAGQDAPLSAADLATLLKVSPKLAQENYLRYQNFDDPSTAGQAGDSRLCRQRFPTYRSCDALRSGSRICPVARTDDFDSLRVGPPFDRIKAYRIAFGLKLPGMPGSLYDYWRPLLTDPLIGTVRGAGGVLVNLASLDVLGALDMDRIRGQVRVVTPEFQERRDGRFETVRTYAKMARGEMTRYILQQRIETPEALKGFEWEGFRFNEAASGPERYLFTRDTRN